MISGDNIDDNIADIRDDNIEIGDSDDNVIGNYYEKELSDCLRKRIDNPSGILKEKFEDLRNSIDAGTALSMLLNAQEHDQARALALIRACQNQQKTLEKMYELLIGMTV